MAPSPATVCPVPWEHGSGCMCGAPLGTRTGAWPDYAQMWMGDTMYPAGRGQDKPQRGWVCSGCGAGWAPWVANCGHCKPQAKPAVAEPQVMGEWGDET